MNEQRDPGVYTSEIVIIATAEASHPDPSTLTDEQREHLGI